MAEDYDRSRQYAYNSNSNLVLEAERERRRRPDEATGEIESLVGKLHHKMGDRVMHAKPPELQERLERLKKKKEKRNTPTEETHDIKKRRVDTDGSVFLANTGATVLTESKELDAFSYKPKTEASTKAYELILGIVQQSIGSQPREILAGAAEEVLEILKNDTYRDPEKHEEVGKLLRNISTANFSTLVELGKKITDFSPNGEDTPNENEKEKEDEGTNEEVDKEMGVAVVFDDEDEESDLDEIHDESEDGDEGEGVEANETMRLRGGDENDDVEMAEADSTKYKLAVHQIDAFWLQREVSKYFDDANVSAKLSEDILNIFSDSNEVAACENQLVLLLDYDKFEFIKLLLHNRSKILYCTRLKQAQNNEERSQIELEMLNDASGEGPAILQALKHTALADSWTQDRIGALEDTSRKEARNLKKLQQHQDEEEYDAVPLSNNSQRPIKNLDIEALAFSQGSHLMSKSSCDLPADTWTRTMSGYEEVHVPAVRTLSSGKEKKVLIEDLPSWTHAAFKGMTSLNRVQSKMYDAAFGSAENLLLCAPTGAGKTNVAVLTILHEIAKARREDGSIDLDSFKIVYIAPMKALVQEVVANFSQRLRDAYGIQVSELSGDQNLSREQIYNTQIIVTTPEKWDIITRKSGDRTYTQLVRLVIIDEIHLLHDSRGPVLESIVARTIRQIETTQEMVRLVGLSATLPNYEDVATFLRINPEKGLFYFDSSYRPVPLQQQYIGIMEKKAIKRFQLMNQICYEKVMEQAGKNQVLIFVHSRKETAVTARALRDLCLENDTLSSFIKENSATSEILNTEAENVKNSDLKELLPYGFCIHHAGMPRSDRNLVEELFADGHLQVLCSTSTLAWGVNLPAHTVIIKGTQMYNAEEGRWTELSPLDIMQMLGRAGRVQYDTQGEGIIITQYSELQYYLSLMNQQLPVESQLIKKLPDSLNAEIVLGSVQNVQEAANWLGYTYLYVRMLCFPALYGISMDEIKEDPSLEQRRLDLAHSAATILAKNNLIKYDRKSGVFQSTALGKVSSHYYVVHQSMAKYNEYMKPNMSDIELFRLFALSHEFRHVVVRSEEKLEMAKLLERVPVPVKESLEDPTAKANVLLQAFISHLKLDGFALLADMVHISQSAARIFRAFFEISLRRGWSSLAQKTLNLCKMVDKRMWLSQTPLRQFTSIKETVLRKIEKKDISWDRYRDLSAPDLGQLVNNPKLGKMLHQHVHQFPRLELSAHVQPITRSTLKVELTIAADFNFEPEIHGNVEAFWILVEDVDGEVILHHEWFTLKRQYAQEEHLVAFTLPLHDPLPPLYFIRVISDRWMHCESTLPVSFHHLILPEKNYPPTELLDLQPISTSALRNKKIQKIFESKFKSFNPIQTQSFSKLYETDENVFLAAPSGSEKIVCAELGILRMLQKNPHGKCVYIVLRKDLCALRLKDWKLKFGNELGLSVGELQGDSTIDFKLLDQHQIILSTPENWDVLSRRWKQRKSISSIDLFIVDEMHLLGVGSQGPTLEVVVSRMRYISAQAGKTIRLIGLSGSIANGKDLGDWIGAKSDAIFSFHPNVRPIPLDILIQGFDINHFSSRLLSMSKPVYNSIVQHAFDQQVIVFVPSRKQTQLSAIDLITFALSSNHDIQFLHVSQEEIDVSTASISDSTLQQTLRAGVGYIYETMNRQDFEIVLDLYERKKIQILIATHSLCWELNVNAHLVVVMETKFFDGREHRYVDYQINSIHQMIGKANQNTLKGSNCCVIMCHGPMKEFYKKFLYNPLPVESHLDHFFADHLNAEIVTKTVENKQEAVDYLTWTFLYRRLSKNPNYYNLQGLEHQHLSDHLSELVETTITNLEESRSIQVEDEFKVSPLNLGMIASYYYIKYTTIELFSCSLSAKTRLKGLIEILSSVTEFADIPMRHREEYGLKKLAAHLPMKIEHLKYNDPAIKTNILLQSHFSRRNLSSELAQDLNFILEEAVRMLQAMVDVISSNGWLKPALATMDLCQMIVQGRWQNEDPLLQIPFFTEKIVKELKELDEEIDSPLDILSMEDEDRSKILNLSPSQMSQVAKFCNSFPDVSIEFEVQDPDEITCGDIVEVVVNLSREIDDEDIEEDQIGLICSSMYPKKKWEDWWIVIGDPESNTLYSIKRLPLRKSLKARLEFTAPSKPGEHNLQLYLVCDSYMGCDLENELKIQVLPGDGKEGEESPMEEE